MRDRTTTSVQRFIHESRYFTQTTNSQHSSPDNCFSCFLFGMLRDRKYLSFVPDFFLRSLRRKSWLCSDCSLSSELRSESYGLHALEKRHQERNKLAYISFVDPGKTLPRTGRQCAAWWTGGAKSAEQRRRATSEANG